MKKMMVPLTLLMLLGAACSDKPAPQTQVSKSTPAAPATTNDSGSASKTSTDSSSNSNTNPGTAAAPSASPAAASSDGSEGKLYRINKNYDVVPIDPQGNKKVVLLTFDDGPKRMEWIQSLIDTLDKHHAKAIFFEVGTNVKAHPDLLKYTLDHGEAIGNHTWDHSDLKKLNNAQIDEEISKTQDMIKQTTGKPPAFFRPPNGDATEHVHMNVSQNGMVFMNWSDGSLDWDPKNTGKPDAIIDNVMKQLHPGSNILMHELPTTVNALDKLLTQIEEKGYTFVDPNTIKFEPYSPN